MSTTIETTAVMDLTPTDLNDLMEELRAYHAIYSPLFQRREQREWAAKYLHGLLLDLPRKSIEPLVLALEGAQPQAVRAMQQFISEGSWDDTALLHRHWEEVDRALGEDDGTLILDGSDFPKQGIDSVGVKRQYCGELGKRANCQAGVFLGYASRQGYTLLDRRLYLPQEWVTEAAYAERRHRCGVPKEIAFTTKPLLGWEMIHAVHQASPLRCHRRAGLVVLGRGTPRYPGLAAAPCHRAPQLVGPGPSPDARPRPGRGTRAYDGGRAGRRGAGGVLEAADDQGGEQRPSDR